MQSLEPCLRSFGIQRCGYGGSAHYQAGISTNEHACSIKAAWLVNRELSEVGGSARLSAWAMVSRFIPSM